MTKKSIGLSLPIRLGDNGFFETTDDSLSQIKSNLINLFLTRPGERRFNNNFGTKLYDYLFEQDSSLITKEILLDVIRNDTNRFLNGVIINDVSSEMSNSPTNNNKNSIFISIKFTYKNTQSSVDFEINV
jgi:phage baseplate assembly protein W